MAQFESLLHSMSEIIEWSKSNSSRLGYYVVLYREVTIAMKRGIENRIFEHNDAIEKLAITFATYFVEAFNQYITERRCPKSWLLVFKLSKSSRLTILQHLVMGINVHINYDLPLALLQISKFDNIETLRKDFHKVNQLLYELTDSFAFKISKIWGKTGFIDQLIGRVDRMILNLMMTVSRKQAWKSAERLIRLSSADQSHVITELDNKVTKYGYIIIQARILASMPFWFRGRNHPDDPKLIIKKLQEP